jgi:peptide/nickel transport system permease protein
VLIAQLIAKRILQAVPLLFGILTLVFFLSRLLPGDAATAFLSPRIAPSVADQVRKQFGLDRSPVAQYVLWIRSAATGDFGYSFSRNIPVTQVLREAYPHTLLLGSAALAIELFIAVVIGYLVTVFMGSTTERALSRGALVVYSLPSFWIGTMILALFSYRLGWFPSSHMHTVGSDTAFDLAQHLMLPSITAALPGAAALARYLHSSITGTVRQEYVLAARSMGLGPFRIFRSYILPNSIGPMLSLVGIEIGILFTGVVVTETLFAWPGFGRTMVEAVFARDYPLMLGCTFIAGATVIAGNLIADVAQVLIDPRRRHVS